MPLHHTLRIRRISRALVLLAGLGWFCALLISLRDLHEYPGVDLRPKVVGARALAAGYDPYVPGFLPQQNDYLKTNSLPYYTPALLLLYEPMRDLAFTTQRTIYFWLDWAFAVGIIFVLLIDFCTSRLKKRLGWIVFSAFLICSSSFRLHLERGQYYMFLLLLMSLSAASIKKNRAGLLSCLPAALLILLRPTYLVMVVAAMVSLKRTAWGLRVIGIGALLFLITLPTLGFKPWVEFVHATQQRQAEHLHQLTPGGYSNLGGQRIPLMIEGQDFSRALPDPGLNGTLIGVNVFVFNSSARLAQFLQMVDLAKWVKRANEAGLLLSILLGSIVISVSRRRAESVGILLAFAFLWPILIELFGPERYFYTTVVEVLPLLLVLLERRDRTRWFWRSFWIVSVFPALVLLNQVVRLPLANSVLCIAVSVLLPVGLTAYCVTTVLAAPAARRRQAAIPVNQGTV